MTKLHIQRLAAAAAAVVISMAGGALCAQQYGGEGFYPAGCVDDTSCLPLPGEAPLSYFGRTLNMTRGPYGHYAETQYPEDCSTLAPPGVDISRAPPTHQEQFASFNADPSELSQSYTEDYQDLVPGGDCCGPSNQKPGVFQKWSFQATQIGAGNDNGATLAQSDLETWVVFGLPCPTRDNPLLITPGYGRHLLSGPNAPDLPSTLHDVYLQFRWMGKVNEFWGYDLVFTPGVYTDFEGGVTGDAWRYTGRAIATYQWAPWTQLVFGVVYLDREDVAALPAFGVIYEPCDGVRWELIAPRPRYARRVYQSCDCEKWWYAVGEFGGGSYAIERANGAPDVVTLRDYRFLLGWETKLNGGAGYKVEAGYVFGREYEYTSGATVQLDSTFLVRGGVTY